MAWKGQMCPKKPMIFDKRPDMFGTVIRDGAEMKGTNHSINDHVLCTEFELHAVGG